MADFYQLVIGEWNEGTDNLTLEQEAAFLRIVNATRLTDLPPRHNMFVLMGLWRCTKRKAERILQELIDAGKIKVVNGSIINARAVKDAQNLTERKQNARTAGKKGGINSGKSKAKPLLNKEQAELPLEPEHSIAEHSITKGVEIEISTSTAAADYSRFLEVHPKPIDTPEGQEMFEQLVSNGVDPNQIIQAAQQYADTVATWSTEARVQQSDNFLDNERGKWKEFITDPKPEPPKREELLGFYADKINGQEFVAPSSINIGLAVEMLNAGLVTEERLRERGIPF